jgi:hypothetical protein
MRDIAVKVSGARFRFAFNFRVWQTVDQHPGFSRNRKF